MKKTLLAAFVIIFGIASFCYALETDTHKVINKHIAKNSFNGFSLDLYLKDQLKIQGGIEESFNSKEVGEWISDGGEYEDIPVFYLPYLRSLNHFHNPITEEGFKGNCGGVSLCVSSTVWALMPLGTQSSITGNYSWYDVRGYYLKALTSTNKTTRDTNFAETFRGLGQLMHLIEDASVPAHTRNDGHLLPNYETWVVNNINKDNLPNYETTSFSGTISNIASFIDTNQYTGSNPADTVNNTIGLSEYTNANFFSEETIFSGFTYPRKEDTEYYEEYMKDWGLFKVYRKYLKKVGGGEQIQHFVYAGRLYKYLDTYPVLQTYTLGLDNNVYNNYASLLLPRAVGYSASLINHFFRGQINMDKDPNNSSQYIIKNETDEYMSGTFTLYYDDTNESRRYLTSWNMSINPNSQSTSVSITEPTDAKEKGKYILVFQGKMGNEMGAVVGRVVQLGETKGRVLYLTSDPNYISVTDGERTTPAFDLRTVLLPGESLIGGNIYVARFDRSDGDTFVVATSKIETTATASGYANFSITATSETISCGGNWGDKNDPNYSRSSSVVATYTLNLLPSGVWSVYSGATYTGYTDTTGCNSEGYGIARRLLYNINNGDKETWSQTNEITKFYLHKFKIDSATFTIQYLGRSTIEKEGNYTWASHMESIVGVGYRKMSITRTMLLVRIRDIYIDKGVVKFLYQIIEETFSSADKVYEDNTSYFTINSYLDRRDTTKYGETIINEVTKTISNVGGNVTSTSSGESWDDARIANQNDVIFSKRTDRSRIYLAPDQWLWSSSAYITDLLTYIRTDSGYSMTVRAAYSASDFKRSFNSTEAGFVEYGGLFVNREDLIGFKLTDFSSGRFYVDLAKIKIDPALPDGYEITTISPLLTWNTTKLLDLILR